MSHRLPIATQLWFTAALAVALPVVVAVAGVALTLSHAALLGTSIVAALISGALLVWAIRIASASLEMATTTLDAFSRGNFDVALPQGRDDQASDVLRGLRRCRAASATSTRKSTAFRANTMPARSMRASMWRASMAISAPWAMASTAWWPAISR